MMLDTCALIWLAQGGGRITKVTQLQISEATTVHVCAISAFEIAHKQTKGELELPDDADPWYRGVLSHHGLTEIPVTGDLVIRAAQLPMIHRDPADRMIIAAAMKMNLPIVTRIREFRKYGLTILG